MPFFRPKGIGSFPIDCEFFAPLGILKDLVRAVLQRQNDRVGRGVRGTCQTLPVTVSTFVINLGVVEVMVCFSTFMPGLSLVDVEAGRPSTATVCAVRKH